MDFCRCRSLARSFSLCLFLFVSLCILQLTMCRRLRVPDCYEWTFAFWIRIASSMLANFVFFLVSMRSLSFIHFAFLFFWHLNFRILFRHLLLTHYAELSSTQFWFYSRINEEMKLNGATTIYLFNLRDDSIYTHTRFVVFIANMYAYSHTHIIMNPFKWDFVPLPCCCHADSRE